MNNKAEIAASIVKLALETVEATSRIIGGIDAYFFIFDPSAKRVANCINNSLCEITKPLYIEKLENALRRSGNNHLYFEIKALKEKACAAYCDLRGMRLKKKYLLHLNHILLVSCVNQVISVNK